ncbi:hypothetical protein [Nonomuraea sp. LPB2021202275-12-8]|uniref:hypothetical protein n=1 Tax=Nonomuraea sp. LPB2021202275-12-8 TaxID=3120159 RepID=UPI00300C478C
MEPTPHHQLTGWQKAQVENTLRIFYTTVRAGQIGLSDGGGPFGFDITVALLVDELLRDFECDAIVETGCFLGDTTEYLARRYPDLPVRSCDVVPEHAQFTRQRLAQHANAAVTCEDSPLLVADANRTYRRPFYFLDAHWAESWPLERELAAVEHGLVLIHDFDVGHERFSYDTYNGLVCGPPVLARMQDPPKVYFTPDPGAGWLLPCLQTGRRAGVGILAIGLGPGPLVDHPQLLTHHLSAEMVTNP